MTLNEFRKEMVKYWHAVRDEPRNIKQPYFALKDMVALYEKFDDAERLLADKVLGEWALSDNENMQYDALVLIEQFKIKSAVPALKELASRLDSSNVPDDVFELQNILRKIALLTV